MAKVSANYEVVYIIDPAQGEEGIAALVAKFKTLAEQNGSAVEVEEWGRPQAGLSHQLQNRGGYYVLMTFSSEPSFPGSWTACCGLPTASCVPDRLQGRVRGQPHAEPDCSHGSADP